MENVSNSNEKTKFTSLFSKRLRETRNERGIKLKEFAEKIDVSINALSNYENGKRIPPCDILRKMAIFLGVSADYLIGVSDENIVSDSAPDTENIIKALITISQLSDTEFEAFPDDCYGNKITCCINFYNTVIRDFFIEYGNVREFMKSSDFADYLKNGLKDTLIKKYVDKCTLINGKLVYTNSLDFDALSEDDLPF